MSVHIIVLQGSLQHPSLTTRGQNRGGTEAGLEQNTIFIPYIQYIQCNSTRLSTHSLFHQCGAAHPCGRVPALKIRSATRGPPGGANRRCDVERLSENEQKRWGGRDWGLVGSGVVNLSGRKIGRGRERYLAFVHFSYIPSYKKCFSQQ